MLPIFDRCCQEPFNPNYGWLDTNLEEAFFLAREVACQLKRIIYWTIDRKHALSCHWLIFQINLELYYIIFSIPENPQCSCNWKTTSSILVFCLIPYECIRNLKQYIFLVAFEFCSLNPPLLHISVTLWISIRASLTDGTDFSTSST